MPESNSPRSTSPSSPASTEGLRTSDTSSAGSKKLVKTGPRIVLPDVVWDDQGEIVAFPMLGDLLTARHR
jgi:hypothetical protein